jgi:stage II sporulation protein AA (anti-sigma F factor antagonist)
MVLKNRRQGSRLTVHLSGELDHHCAKKVRQEMDRLLADTAIKELVLDLRGLEFMDSSGIGVLMGRYRTLSKRGGRMRVCNLSGQVERVFNVSGLYRIIEM